MKVKVAVACALLLAGIAEAAEPSDDQKIIELGKLGVQEKLKDPESAQFKNLAVHRGNEPVENTYYVCGEVNSKNAFGGYVGFQPFYAMVFYYPDQGKGMSGLAGIWQDTDDQAGRRRMFDTICTN